MHIYRYVHCSEWDQEVKEVNKRNRSFVHFTLFRFNLFSTSLFILSQYPSETRTKNKKRTEDWPPSKKSIINNRRSDGSNFRIPEITQNGYCVCYYSNRSFVTKKSKYESARKRKTETSKKKMTEFAAQSVHAVFWRVFRALTLKRKCFSGLLRLLFEHIFPNTPFFTVWLTLRSLESLLC